MKDVASWLIKAPAGGVMPSFDRYASMIFKVFYLLIRIIFRILMGKEKRDNSSLFQKLYIGDSFSLSFLLMMFFYKIRRSLRIASPKLIKIKVPKYNYQAYCSPNKDDFVNMTIREQDILDHFNPESGEMVVDIGAHTGRYTIISSNRVGEEGKVIAIEANPSVFEILNKNIDLNKLTNVKSLNYAVFSKNSQLKLFLPGEEENSTKKVRKNNDDSTSTTIYNTIMTDRAKDEDRFVMVNAKTLDQILQEQGINASYINWIKIDVEGAELEVLKGAHNILSTTKKITMLIEIHDLGNGRNYYDPIIDLLKNYGFRIQFEKTYDGREKHLIVNK